MTGFVNLLFSLLLAHCVLCIPGPSCNQCVGSCLSVSHEAFCRKILCSQECSDVSECPGLDIACDCPKSSLGFYGAPPTRSEICARLPSSVLLVGDSIIRDTWTAGALWLLMPELPHFADCMFAAWTFVPAVIEAAKTAGLLVEDLTAEKSVSVFYVCQRRVRLVFRYGRLFSDLPAVREEALAQGAGALFISHGILEMSTGDADLRPWARALSRLPYPVVYLGTHSRNVAMTPPEFMHVALNTQGNEALQRYTHAVQGEARDSSLRVVDCFNLTASLGRDYRDTADGLHFGGWINLQRFWMATAAIALFEARTM